jgi:MFS family permease
MTTTPTRPAYAKAWRNAIFIVFTLNGFGAAAWISRIPSIRDHLEISVAEVGLLILGVSAGAIVGMILSSHVVHWLGERRVIMLFLAGCGVSLLVVGFGATVLGSFVVTVIGFALYGFTSGICDVGMNVSGAGSERANGRNIMPWFHASWSFGTVAGSAVGAAAAFAGVDVALHLGLVGVVQIVGALLIIRWIPTDAALAEENGDTEPVTFRERMAIWLNPRTLLIGLLVLGMAFTEGSANDWIAIGFIDDRGFDNGQGALMFGVFTVAMTAGRLAGVPLLDRFGRVPVLRGAALAAAIGLAIVILVPVIPLAVVGARLPGRHVGGRRRPSRRSGERQRRRHGRLCGIPHRPAPHRIRGGSHRRAQCPLDRARIDHRRHPGDPCSPRARKARRSRGRSGRGFDPAVDLDASATTPRIHR